MDESAIPEDLRPFVTEVLGPVTAEQLSSYITFSEAKDRSFKINTIVNAWKEQQTSERDLRKRFATGIFVMLAAQCIAINGAFFLIGFEYMKVEKWVATTFIMAVFAELVTMTLIVLRYLFPKTSKELMNLIENI